jgi:predicted RNA binding protein YcfA (HicA-like mRNA interferase family)
MPRVTYRQVKHVLSDLGFLESPTQGGHLLYVHPAAHAKILMPRAPERDFILPTTWLGIRRTIYEYGIMDPEELDARVYAIAG